MNNRIKLLFEDMSLSSDYELLEWGKNDDELKYIASKKGLQIPSKDLSIFKCRYAMVDSQNKNKCTLPRKEVKKAIKTLSGKAIDKDHFRKATIGYWLDAELEDSDIIAYGAFWKSNFPEDYDIIKDRMSTGKMKISFEAWGERKFKEDGSYELLDIEFAGGALLFDTEPAFPDAEVMEFSANRVLEFAKVVETENKEVSTENANGMKTIQIPMNEPRVCKRCAANFTPGGESRNTRTDEEYCPNCEMWLDEHADDEDLKCVPCYRANLEGTELIDLVEESSKETKIKEMQMKIKEMEDKMGSMSEEEKKKMMVKVDDMKKKMKSMQMGFEIIEDAKKLTYRERKKINDEMFAVVVEKDGKKIRLFPIHDPAHVRNALARLPQASETLRKLGVSPETVKNKILKRARELNMTELLKRHTKGGYDVDELLKKYQKASVEETVKFIDESMSSLTAKDAEIATLKAEKDALVKSLDESKLIVENSKLEVEKIKTEAANVKAELDKRLAAEKAAFVKSRRDELGEEFAKDVSDEDIVDDLKFENIKLKKEIASLKKGQPATAGLEAGAKTTVKDEGIFKTQSNISTQAFKKDK